MLACPNCGAYDWRILQSRRNPDGIKRRRECLRCSGRITTQESVVVDREVKGTSSAAELAVLAVRP